MREVVAEEYTKYWQEYEPKIAKTLNDWVIPGVVGCTFDDLWSVAQQSLYYALKYFDPSRGKFSTLFYNSLFNAIKTEYKKAGLVQKGFRIRLVDKRTGDEKLLQQLFSTKEAAREVASAIGRKRRIATVVYVDPGLEEAVKKGVCYLRPTKMRIPPTDVCSLPCSYDNGEEDQAYQQQVKLPAVYDRPSTVSVLRTLARYVSERAERRVLKMIYFGQKNCCSPRFQKKYQSVIESLRKRAYVKEVLEDVVEALH
jgi:hypothetical protein